MERSNGRLTPYRTSAELLPLMGPDEGCPHTFEKYGQLVGEFRCLADYTHRNLTYLTGKLGAAMNATTKRHWTALKVVIRYLFHTTTTGLHYTAGKKWPSGLALLPSYTDSSFARDASDRK